MDATAGDQDKGKDQQDTRNHGAVELDKWLLVCECGWVCYPLDAYGIRLSCPNCNVIYERMY